MDIIVYVGIFFIIVLLIVLIAMLYSIRRKTAESALRADAVERSIGILENNMDREIKAVRAETVEAVQKSFEVFAKMLSDNQNSAAMAQDKRLAELSTKFNDMTVQNEQRLENIRGTVETRLRALTEDNNKQLEEMRKTVDEKLQKTLEDRITQSFRMVSDRLEQVYKGLGEMQTLASGVGDLKKVLSNVKTRGILGENLLFLQLAIQIVTLRARKCANPTDGSSLPFFLENTFVKPFSWKGIAQAAP